jgi:MHS family proline/betaine transporter-like MFS transporter
MPGVHAESHVANPMTLNSAQWRVVALASLGGSLEYYEFIIYGIFS